MNDVQDNIDKLKVENVHLSAYYDMYLALKELQDTYKEKIQFSSFNDDEIRQQILAGKPLILNSGIDLSGMTTFLMDIFKVYAQFTSLKTDEALTAIEKLTPDLPEILEEFLYLKGDTLIKAHVSDSLPDEILIFLIKNTLTPLLEKYSTCVISSIDFDSWERGCCPVCGHPPGLAELRKSPSGRQRYLFCSLCHTSWPFQRLKCPFCEKLEEKETEYLSFPDEENYRVDVCNSCNSFIKTVINNNAELPPVLLDWSSQYVDDTAIQKGYKRVASM
ncbi:MAG: Protein FdhE [Candidatus Scalindua rubra]|uniref:Protein FdhE n=1 Tax=Candidatus Scalindua rubra TaxID=1872076 RepID=A0A1E3XEG7_9BACT|nr:MAG: Protein FdhE [Candidatus Scalindua rubra]